MKTKKNSMVLAAAALMLVAACGEQEVIIPGERLDIFEPSAEEALEELVDRAQPLSLVPATVNADWSHRNGNAAHMMQHNV